MKPKCVYELVYANSKKKKKKKNITNNPEQNQANENNIKEKRK